METKKGLFPTFGCKMSEKFKITYLKIKNGIGTQLGTIKTQDNAFEITSILLFY